jgi:Ran GTPase-activating protein (RanGAP) involved in mRNA processing and transport
LDLSSNKISDEGIMTVIKAICETQIEEFLISHNRLTEKSAEPIAQTLKVNKHLKFIDLSNNKIDNRVA